MRKRGKSQWGWKVQQNANKLQYIEKQEDYMWKESRIYHILTKQSSPFLPPLFLVNNVIFGIQTTPHIMQGIRSIASSIKLSLAHQFSSLVTLSHPHEPLVEDISLHEVNILISIIVWTISSDQLPFYSIINNKFFESFFDNTHSLE